MNNRWFAILIVACLVLVGAGCASEEQRKRYTEDELLLPRQTGSNLSRRFIPEDASSFKKKKTKKRSDSTKPSKKPVKTERTEPERAEPERPETPTPAPPDRFR